MKTNTKIWVLLLASCAAITQSGCATITKGDRQEIQVSTDPPGAKCELRRNSEVLALVEPTPDVASINKNAAAIEVTCTKPGYQPATEQLSSQFNGATFGNLLVGGLIGLYIDANSGANYDYPTSVYLKLAPNEFKSAEARDEYFEAWRAELLQDASRAKSTLAKQCRGDECALVEARTDEQVQVVMERMDAVRKASAVAGTTPAPGTTSPAAGTGEAVRAANQTGIAQGAKWRYRAESNRRPLGNLTVEATSVSATEVSERITQSGHGAFNATRDVSVGNAPPRFQPVVVLPGGYQLAELAPYYAVDAPPKVGARWSDIGGDYYIPGFGKRQLSTQVSIVANESIVVPAGRFDTVRIETLSTPVHFLGSEFKVKCVYWYAPKAQRTAKMIVEIVTTISVLNGKEVYELQSYEPGM